MLSESRSGLTQLIRSPRWGSITACASGQAASNCPPEQSHLTQVPATGAGGPPGVSIVIVNESAST